MSTAPMLARRARLAVLALALGAVAVPLAGPAPAGAAPAPLVTDDGIGVRVDEASVPAAALAALEAALQPVLDDLLDDFLVNGPPPPVPSPDLMWADGDVELALDLDAPGPGRPDGAARLHADVDGLAVHVYDAGEWWQPECTIDFEASFAPTDATAVPDRLAAPAPPFAALPPTSAWDQDPAVTVSNWLCHGYLINQWWIDWWLPMVDPADPASVASQFAALLDAPLADLLADLWAGDVAPVLASVDAVSGFAVDLAQLRFDDHGLVTTADVDASGGFTFPGSTSTHYVAGAEDAGVTSDVDALLAQRTTPAGPSAVIVSLHPNLFNQYLDALTTHLGGTLSDEAIGAGIELPLLELPDRPLYADDRWSARLRTGTAPRLRPSAPGGAPVLQVPGAILELRNPSLVPADPRVTTFAGPLDGGELLTTASPCCTPAFDVAPMTWAAVRTQADAAAATTSPPPTAATLRPWALDALQAFLDQHVAPLASIAVDGLPGAPASLCTTCGRYAGDERYTETFHV